MEEKIGEYGILVSYLSSANVTTVLIFVLSFLALSSRKRRQSLPPGPRSLPVIGSLLSLVGSDILSTFQKLRGKYGDIYSFYIGQHLIIVLNGYATIQTALVKRGAIFSNRPETRFSKQYQGKGIAFATKHVWKQNRRVMQMGLQEVGFSKSAKPMEERILGEISALLEVMDKHKESFDAGDIINKSFANVVSEIIFGRNYGYDDPAFNQLMQAVMSAVKGYARATVLLESFPILRYIPGDVLKLRYFSRMIETNERFYRQNFEEHMDSFSFDNVRDFVDLYISKMKKGNADNFSQVDLQALQGDMIGAASDTSASTLKWFFLYLLHNPGIQRKLHRHIDEVIGKDREPRLSDRASLPYVEATICETLRIASPLPLAVPHTVDDDTDFGGYVIPANTTVLINIDSALKDARIWDEPLSFRPERFLNSKGQLEVPKEFIVFSLGRRSCIGESIARQELFLYVTSLLQRYEFHTRKGVSPPEPSGEMDLTFCPVPYSMRLVDRT